MRFEVKKRIRNLYNMDVNLIESLNDSGTIKNGTNVEYSRVKLPMIVRVIWAITYTWIIFSNLMILIAFIRSRKMRKNAYTTLVLMHTVSDLLVGFFAIAAGLLLNTGFLNRISCSLIWHIFSTGVATSLYQTFLICVNRLLAAFSKKQLNRTIFVTQIKKTVIGIWVFIQVYLLLTVLLQSHNDFQGSCALEILFGDNVNIMKRTLVVLYVPVFLLTIIMYLITLVKIHRYYIRNRVGIQIQVRTVPERCTNTIQQTDNAAANTFISDKRYILQAIKTLGLVLLALTVLTGPFAFCLVISALGYDLSPNIMNSLSSLVILNSLTNPIIYTLRFQDIRSELKSMYFDCLRLFKRMKDECLVC